MISLSIKPGQLDPTAQPLLPHAYATGTGSISSNNRLQQWLSLAHTGTYPSRGRL